MSPRLHRSINRSNTLTECYQKRHESRARRNPHCTSTAPSIGLTRILRLGFARAQTSDIRSTAEGRTQPGGIEYTPLFGGRQERNTIYSISFLTLRKLRYIKKLRTMYNIAQHVKSFVRLDCGQSEPAWCTRCDFLMCRPVRAFSYSNTFQLRLHLLVCTLISAVIATPWLRGLAGACRRDGNESRQALLAEGHRA